MISNLLYLAAAVVAAVFVFDKAPSTSAGIALCVLVIAIMAVAATLIRDTAELVQVIAAVTDLVRGRPGSPPP